VESTVHLAPVIRDLAVILGIAGIITYIFRKIKQPVVLGYLVAGFIVGPHTPPFPLVSDLPNIKVWAEIGIIFVMFSLGLDFSFQKLVRLGRSASFTALGQVFFMLLLGYGTGRALGWKVLDCFFLGGILAISSTTIIFKAFDELKLNTRSFAEQVFGVLIVEDLIAILLLVSLSTVAATNTIWDVSLLVAIFQLVVVVGGWFLIGYFVIPTFFRRIGRWMDAETWTVLSVGLCLLMVVAATSFGYSPALGAFIMGSILAETREADRIEHLMRPLRDLFAAVFFVSIGMLVEPRVMFAHFPLILLITAVTIVGKIVGVTISSLFVGQPLKSSVRAGFSLAQIGEFSFIIAALGSELQVTSSKLFPVAVAVSTLTTFTTPYLIRLSAPFADWLERSLPATWREGLVRYASRTGNGMTYTARSFASRAVRFGLNAILVTITFILASRFVLPYLETHFPQTHWLVSVTWGAAVLLTAPFIWGMYFAFRDPLRETGGRHFPSFLAHTATVLWIGLLSAAFFDAAATFLVTLGAAFCLFLVFYRRLGGAYRWFEGQLVSNLKDGTDTQMQTLAPWDLRLFKVTLHPNSLLMGQSLAGSQLRQRYGLNIVAIQRGSLSIAAPRSTEILHPMDTVLVLGTEGGLEKFKQAAESAQAVSSQEKDLSDYHLDRLYIGEDSPYKGLTIRDSGIREQLGALIVGLENGAFRTTSPDPGRNLQLGDTLWMVSDR
jgi:monovalent cation:H+ antiporter-2, CPA2 family